jgi:deoxyadenosine/deoxycytidine kinase
VQKEVNNVINNHLTNKNYNVNDAQIWTNQICDDVHIKSHLDSQKHYNSQQKLQVYSQLHHNAKSRLWTQHLRIMLLG